MWTPNLYEPKVKILPPTFATADCGRFCMKKVLIEKNNAIRNSWSNQESLDWGIHLTFVSLISEIHSLTKEFSFPRTASLQKENHQIVHRQFSSKALNLTSTIYSWKSSEKRATTPPMVTLRKNFTGTFHLCTFTLHRYSYLMWLESIYLNPNNCAFNNHGKWVLVDIHDKYYRNFHQTLCSR